MEFSDGPKIYLVVDAYRRDCRRPCPRVPDFGVLLCAGRIGGPYSRVLATPTTHRAPRKTFRPLTGHWSGREGLLEEFGDLAVPAARQNMPLKDWDRHSQPSSTD
jgi:hypothetical protein